VRDSWAASADRAAPPGRVDRPAEAGQTEERPVAQPPVPTAASAAISDLLAGNQRSALDARIHPYSDAARRRAVVAAQKPFAVVLGCSDSRVPVEMVFDRGIGDLFVVRTAGHGAGPEALASIEYGVAVLGAPLIVVLGHESCGAVAAAREIIEGSLEPAPTLRPILDLVVPNVRYAHDQGALAPDEIIATHVARTVEAVRAGSPAAADPGRAVIGMTYSLTSGLVTVLDGERWGLSSLAS
jgi:carbonic anhydrase